MTLSFSFPSNLPFRRAGVSIGVRNASKFEGQSRLPSVGARDPRNVIITLLAFLLLPQQWKQSVDDANFIATRQKFKRSNLRIFQNTIYALLRSVITAECL